jgi:uncharacterized protein
MDRRLFLSAASVFGLSTGIRPGFAAPTTPNPVTIGVMGGEIDGTFMRCATDLSQVLNSDSMRIIPVVGKGSLQNMGDLLHLRGIDMGFVAADALTYAQQNNIYPGEVKNIAYISKLYDNDVHVCARPEINSLQDLNGKPVNIDVDGAGTNLTARAIFKALNITPIFRTEEPTVGQSRLQRGEIAANIYVSGRPVRLFATVPAGTNLHFLPIQLNAELEKTYLPGGELTSKDYPTLVPDGSSIPTIGVGVTLAVYNWQPGTDRYRNLSMFVDAFFSKFPELLKPPHHPVWHQVNLAASQPGWVRFKPAADWLDRNASKAAPAPVPAQAAIKPQPSRAEFEAFLANHGGTKLTAAQRDATWQYFMQQMKGATP